jgi:hypothetical protein
MADVLAITTAWDEFRGLALADLKVSNGKPTVLDCWRLLRDERFEDAVQHLKLGLGSETPRCGPERGDALLSRTQGN